MFYDDFTTTLYNVDYYSRIIGYSERNLYRQAEYFSLSYKWVGITPAHQTDQ